MKKQVFVTASFLGKSLLWSLLLYMLAVVILDWNELSMKLSSGDKLELVQTSVQQRNNPVIISVKQYIPGSEIKPGA